MSTDFEIRRCLPDAARAAITGLSGRYPGVTVAGADTEFEVGIRSFPRIASVSIRARSVRISGRWGTVLAWVTRAIADDAKGAAWDPQEEAPLRDAPSWEDTLAKVVAAELERDGPVLATPTLPSATENAARFLAMLEEQELIELAATRTSLYEAVSEVLDGPPKGRATRLEKLLLSHPGVVELFTDHETLAALLMEWG